MSAPTISDPAVMATYPQARRRERDALLDLVALAPGETAVDLQAAGGYVADGIRARFGPQVQVICVEPTELRHRIPSVHRVCTDPLHAMTSLADDSVDAVIGLAGLHHSEDMVATLRECRRILRAGGTFALCDVEAGSTNAAWLNGFVATHNPAGHDGRFLPFGGIGALLRDCGFAAVHETRRNVPWCFGSEIDMAHFFTGLFGLALAPARVRAAVKSQLDVATSTHGVEVGWPLVYASARRPPA